MLNMKTNIKNKIDYGNNTFFFALSNYCTLSCFFITLCIHPFLSLTATIHTTLASLQICQDHFYLGEFTFPLFGIFFPVSLTHAIYETYLLEVFIIHSGLE